MATESGALRAFLCGDTALRAVDVLLWLAGAAFGVALADSFLHWLARPPDADALIALGMLLAFVASFFWFVRMVFRLVLRPGCVRWQPPCTNRIEARGE